MNDLDRNAELAALLFEESGLNASLTFLFKCIKKDYPITRIFINFRSIFDFSTIPIANVFNENHQYIDARGEGDSAEPFIPTKNIVLIEDITVDTLVSSYMAKLDNTHRSLLSIPFFKSGNYFFCIGIAADVEQDFPKDKVDYFMQLFTPLAKNVEKNFHSNPKNIQEQIIQTNNSLEYIKQYKGFKTIWEHINKVAPTVCEWLGVGVHPDMTGLVSINPLEEAPKEDKYEEHANQAYRERIGLKEDEDQWTCAANTTKDVPESDELYDHKYPFQLHNLADKHPDVCRKLYDQLRAFMSEIRAS